jgi:hypothetical protein
MAHHALLTRADIERLFALLDEELAHTGTKGEVYLLGGAVMCLALSAREATRDVDAVFEPSGTVRAAAARVASRAGVEPSWLNDAVKVYLSVRGDFVPWFEREHLRVYTAQPRYLLAMKCMAIRLGPEFHDLDDVRFLLRWLNITDLEAATDIVTHYFVVDQLPVRTRYALEELLGV